MLSQLWAFAEHRYSDITAVRREFKSVQKSFKGYDVPAIPELKKLKQEASCKSDCLGLSREFLAIA